MILETLEGFLEADPYSEVMLREDGRAVAHLLPGHHFRLLGIREGDRFWLDAIEEGGSVRGRIRPAAPEPRAEPVLKPYLSHEELGRLADPWEAKP